MKNILAFSGGKDSTACALLCADRGMDFELFFTPTGDEPDGCVQHIAKIASMTGKKLVARSCGKSLYGLIEGYNSLPNNRQRWCTRQLKIEVCKSYLLEHPGSTLLVGLRADEEHREGMWGEFCEYSYPLRDAGWGINDVYAYLESKGVCVPERTDCELCYDQRIIEWWHLWKNKPEKFAKGEALKAQTGHTFRSPSRDTWPAGLADLRKEFEGGRLPREVIPLPLFNEHAEPETRCRVCSL